MRKTDCMRWITWFLVLVIFHSCQSPQQNSKKARAISPVSVGEVTQQDLPIYLDVIGNVYSLQNVQIRPQVGGIIQEAYIKEGQYVKEGDPLYKIDPRPYKANLDKAKAALIKDTANLKFAEEQVKRYTEVVKKEFVAKLTYDQYVSQVELNRGQVLSDEADIALAELELEWSIPKSPLTGKVSQNNIDPGNLVTANDPNAVTNIRQINPAGIRLNLTQSDFIEVQKTLNQAQKPLQFEVILPQESDKPRQGQIFFIDNQIDQTTGTILLKGTVPNGDEFLWPGEFIRVRLLLKNQPQALMVPAEAVKIGQEGSYLYVYLPDSSTVEYRKVTLIKGGSLDNLIGIDKGVRLGEKVIVKGQNNLLPGAKVSIVSPSEEP